MASPEAGAVVESAVAGSPPTLIGPSAGGEAAGAALAKPAPSGAPLGPAAAEADCPTWSGSGTGGDAGEVSVCSGVVWVSPGSIVWLGTVSVGPAVV